MLRWLFSVSIDCLLLPVALITMVVSTCKRKCDRRKESEKPSIVLLHGSGSNHSTMLFSRLWLDKQWEGSVHTMQYSNIWLPDNVDIPSYAERVREKLLQLSKESHKKDFIFIGHSMGGLVASYYTEHYAEKDGLSIPVIITIGTPWRGSPLIEPLRKQHHGVRYINMTPNSKFLQILSEKAKKSKTKYVCIGSRTDFLVPYPYSQLHTKNDEMDYICDYSGHYGMIVSPQVWSHITKIILQVGNVSLRDA